MKTNYKLNNEQLEFYKNKDYLVCNEEDKFYLNFAFDK